MAVKLGQPLGIVKTWVLGALKILRENLLEPSSDMSRAYMFSPRPKIDQSDPVLEG